MPSWKWYKDICRQVDNHDIREAWDICHQILWFLYLLGRWSCQVSMGTLVTSTAVRCSVTRWTLVVTFSRNMMVFRYKYSEWHLIHWGLDTHIYLFQRGHQLFAKRLVNCSAPNQYMRKLMSMTYIVLLSRNYDLLSRNYGIGCYESYCRTNQYA